MIFARRYRVGQPEAIDRSPISTEWPLRPSVPDQAVWPELISGSTKKSIPAGTVPTAIGQP